MKWSGAVLTVLLLVVWVGSGWWQGGFALWPTVALDVRAGRVAILWEEPWSIIPVSSHWFAIERHSDAFSWWFDAERVTWGGPPYTIVRIPIWVLVVLIATPTLWLWRCDRRKQPGLCVKCGYDLRGADHKVCPECGAALQRAAPVR